MFILNLYSIHKQTQIKDNSELSKKQNKNRSRGLKCQVWTLKMLKHVECRESLSSLRFAFEYFRFYLNKIHPRLRFVEHQHD